MDEHYFPFLKFNVSTIFSCIICVLNRFALMEGGKIMKNQSSGMKKSEQDDVQKNKVAIAVAWIGFFATILAALISVFGNKISPPSSVNDLVSSPTGTVSTIRSFVPSNTALANTPTSIPPVPEADTPVPTFTRVPSIAIGEDWMKGCISSLWKAYPSNVLTVERGDGCWREPVSAFSAENGDLDFLDERSGSGTAELIGLFAPLPESGTVTFTVRLRHLDNVDLWMGVFSEPDVTSRGLLMAILNGDVKKRSFVQKEPLTYETIQGTVVLNQGNGYSISFAFDTLSVRSIINPAVFVTNPFPLQVQQKWLFLGYKGLRGAYRVEGTFLNFELKTP
ncbi:MAG: hypothetical protein IH588_15690 [Anaerolineales bacterium]|nr:hypothetical protein [Anaerolineales bacterium]